MARRVFWGALLGLHLLALPSAATAFSDASDLSGGAVRLCTLSLAILFLLLKLLDLRCLRLAPGWHSVVASFTLVALLHVMAIERQTDGRLSARTTGTAILMSGCAGLTAGTARRGLQRLALRRLSFAQPLHDDLLLTCWLVDFVCLGRPPTIFTIPQLIARPPPGR